MSLVAYTITAIERDVADAQLSGKQIIAGATCSMYSQPDDTAVLLYDDAEYTNGSTAKTTGTSGQVVVYVEQGYYRLSVNGADSYVTVGSDSPINALTTAELTASKPTQTGQKATNQERANAEYVLQESGYTALTGDITASNGRVWALQIADVSDARWFGSLQDAISRTDTSILSGGSWSVSSVSMASGKTIMDMEIIGTASGDLIDIPDGEDNVTIQNVTINGDGNSSNLIKGNDSTGIYIKGCSLSGSDGNDIVLRASTLLSDVVIEGNKFTNSTGTNILVGKTSGLKIKGNTFNGWGATSFDSISHVDGVSDGLVIEDNDFTNASAGLFAIECAGSTQRQTGAVIKNNRMHSAYCGISGRFVDSEISSNRFFDGNGNWRSGIEIGGYGNQIHDNWIYDGAIALTSSGDTGDSNTSIYLTNTQVHSNYVRSTLENGTAMYIGGGGGAGAGPLAKTVSVLDNTFDMSDGSGTTTKIVRLGYYGSDIIIEDLDFCNNYIVGPNGVTSFDGVRIDGLSGSGRLKIKSNSFIDTPNAIRFASNVYDMVVIKLNDAATGVNNLTVGTMTNTSISENDI